MEEEMVDCLGTSGLGEFPESESPVAFSCLLFVLSLELEKAYNLETGADRKKKKKSLKCSWDFPARELWKVLYEN